MRGIVELTRASEDAKQAQESTQIQELIKKVEELESLLNVQQGEADNSNKDDEPKGDE